MFERLERKFGKYAIKNLMKYIIILYALGFILAQFAPEVYYYYLCLDAAQILRGQVWRIFTFLICSPNDSWFFIIFSLLLYYMLGSTLERAWGAFKFNVYYFTGVLGIVLASIIVYLITDLSGLSFYMDTYYINMSLFLAFATIAPDTKLMLYFILPIKIKWLAYLDAAILLYSFVVGTLATRVSIGVSLLNFLIYFLLFMRGRISPKQVQRKMAYKSAVHRSQRPTDIHGAHHKCAVCGRTELDNDTLEFRYCSKCNGNFEYCQDHLFIHTHVK